MRLLALIAIYLLQPFLSGAHQIALGYHSPFAKVWRFYEQNPHGEWVPKILVYNNSSGPITFCMKVVLSDRELQQPDFPILMKYLGVYNDTIVRPVIIPAQGYGIYQTESLVTDKYTSFYDAIYINGLCGGIGGIKAKFHPPDNRYRFYASEGVNGGGDGLIGTDNFFTGSGEPGHLTIYYQCTELKRSFPLNIWHFEPWVYQGIGAITFRRPDGDCFRVGSDNPKVGFPVSVEKLDSFRLEADYVITRSDTLPEICLYRQIGGGKAGMTLPLFLK